MKSIKLKILLSAFVIAISTLTSFGQAVAFCPSISAITPTSPICLGSCATLSASVIPVNQTTSYSIQSIPYIPFAYTGGTGVSVGTDDVWSPVINLGFNFCYFGNTYNKCLLGSNGQLTFSISPPLPSGYDNWVISTAIPSLNDMPGNTICAVFRDIDPSFGGNMRYYFSGTSPCRALVIYWDNIPLYSNPGSCSGKANSTFQLVLYENTNFIDVYIQNSTDCVNWNGGAGIVGIQNINATLGYSPPLRNFPTVWTGTNEAWRFVPTGAQSYTVTWSGPSGIVGTGLTQTVCPTVNTTYTASMDVTSCSGVNSTYTSVVTVSVSPNPPPVITQGTLSQLSCSTFTNGDNVVLSSGSPGYTVNWSPPPVSTSSTATTFSASGMTVGVNIISVVDAFGCNATQTILVTPPPIVPTFSIDAPLGTVIGCAPPTLPLNAINTNTAVTGMTYTWTSATQPASVTSSYNGYGTTVYTITGQGVSATNTNIATCASSITFAVTSNTAVPSMTVSPISASISCNGGCKTFTAVTTTTTNLNGTWYDPFGNPIVGPSGTPLLMCANAPGTYTATFVDVTNACSTSQTVAVSSNTSVPTISVTSVFGFVLNCTRPCLPMSINSSGTLAPTTYTWTNLTTSISTSPLNGGFTVCITGANTAGSYEAAFMDGNFCKVTTTINVTIDTLRPSPLSSTNLPSNSYTLTCFTPSLVATALSNPLYASNNYSWTIPGPFVINSNTINVGTGNIPGPTGSSITYTVTVLGPNGCIGKQKVNFYKDSYVPPYGVAFTPSAITCANPCVALTATTVPSTTTAVTYTFTSPPPTATATTAGALMCTPGTYTMVYMNVNNGCKNTANCTVPLNVTPPATFALLPQTIGCGATSTTINAGHTGSASATTYSYTWKPPLGAGMSCPGGINCYSSTANMAGIYQVFILNTINGCAATNSVQVFNMGGALNAGITANPGGGFAPLTVSFSNTSSLSVSNSTITTVWNYGNGISMTYSGTAASYSTTGPPAGSSVYQSAGSYTVYMIITQYNGTLSCTGTASTVVNVELPSKLDIPNVFTPNGDGVNDYFTLLTTNLTNITCKIFDRWGVKMYDVTSDKGNISWDGKNFSNKDVPAGTYFYILTAEGKDGKTSWIDDKGQEIKQTGTISLFR